MHCSTLKASSAANNIIVNVPTFISIPETDTTFCVSLEKKKVNGKSPQLQSLLIVLLLIVSKITLIPSGILSS